MDHGYLNTIDGLNEEDHNNGYHYYGAYKVMHICQVCYLKRRNMKYDSGWNNTLICGLCEAKKIAHDRGISYPELVTEDELWKLLYEMRPSLVIPDPRWFIT